MPSKFGGIPVEQESQPVSRFGGVPVEAEVAPPTEAPETPGYQDALQGLGKTADAVTASGLEFAAAFNRGATRLADFLTTDQINAVSEILGSEFRAPSITEMTSAGTQGNFMEPGLARDVVRSAGELVPAAASGGAMVRQAAQGLPRFAAATEGVGAGIVREAGKSTAPGDIALGAAAGAGQELGGEAGEAVGGETGRYVGEVIGALGLPIAISVAPGAAIRESGRAARGAVSEAAPDIAQLKSASREIYGEIDDLGVALKPEAANKLADELATVGKEFGMDPDIVPKAAKSLRRFDEVRDMSPSLSDIDTLRRVAQNAARSVEPAEAAAGGALVRRLDDFLDDLSPDSLQRGTANPQEVSQKYRQARDLWGRARRSELVEEAFTKAKNQASGFENGLRIQFRSLLNNKKTRKMFSPEEQAAMRRVVEGGRRENLFRLLGRFAPSEGAAHNVLTSGAGVAGGAAMGGPLGAVAVPTLGYVSRSLAARMTAKNAEFADRVIRAGRDANRITQAYLRHTPKEQRSAEELSELLMRPDVDLSKAEMGIAKEAAALAKPLRAEIFGAAAGLESANDPVPRTSGRWGLTIVGDSTK